MYDIVICNGDKVVFLLDWDNVEVLFFDVF